MSAIHDGPCSPHFQPLPFRGIVDLSTLVAAGTGDGSLGFTEEMSAALEHAPDGACVCWGIPFEIDEVVILSDHPVSIEVDPTRARWLVFQHTLDVRPPLLGPDGSISPAPRSGRLGEPAANYVICYADGSEAQAAIRRRHQIGPFARFWGENCFEAVAHHKPTPHRAAHEQLVGEITARMRRTLDVDMVLQTAVQEMRDVMGLSEAEVWLGIGLQPEDGNGQPEA